MNFAAAIWLLAALSALQWPSWSLLAPPALSILIAAVCLARAGQTPSPPLPVTIKAMNRIVSTWSIVQAILIAVAAFVLVRSGNTELLAPVIAIIVGLHFVPIAHGIGLPLYYWTAAALCLIGVTTYALDLHPSLAFAGTGAAIALYLTSVALTTPLGAARHAR